MKETCLGGWGFVIRDHLGNAIAVGTGQAKHLLNGRQVEALVCLKGLEHAASLGMEYVVLETDAITVAEAIHVPGYDRSLVSPIF